MIISKIQGGLGNQMFQYAYGRSLANKNNTKLYLDKRFYDGFQGNVVRTFLLDKFHNADVDTLLETIQSNYPINRISDNFNYRLLPRPVDCSYYLDGYWQSERYFKEFESVIRHDFSPTFDIIDNILLKYPMVGSNCTSIHIRRTDYITSNGYHPVQSLGYYKSAIDIIGDYDNLFIFSDDIKWCEDNFHFDNMIFVKDNDDVFDLYLMSLCSNNIIANSSFSWWGAWLNNNLDKKVIAPKSWFGKQANLNESDIVPEKWIRI
jgi:hypothetical protein